MTTPNTARDPKPGKPFAGPNGSTWVLTTSMSVIPAPWMEITADGETSRHPQEEAEKADLVPLVTQDDFNRDGYGTECHLAGYARGKADAESNAASGPVLGLTNAEVPAAVPASLNPDNPDQREAVANFLSSVASEVGGAFYHHVRETQGLLRSGAVTVRRQHAEAEQDRKDRARAEEIAMAAWADGDGYAQWHNAPEQLRADLTAAALAGIRAGRAERERQEAAK